ncbi:MAG: hypothetical protein JWM05_922 [Acidimicrobiales bacterium]|nr:hypothetical protein [Acidimicrobiales bacterium]
MSRLRPHPGAVFAAVTLVIWGNRVWLNWTNPDVGVAAKVALSVPITCFVIASVVLLVTMWRGVDRTSPGFRNLVTAFAAGTALFWAIRLPMILVHAHPVAFKIVHGALALASVAAAAAAWRSLPSTTPAADGDRSPATSVR